MQKEADHCEFDIAVLKVHECVVSATGVTKNAIKRINKVLLKFSGCSSYLIQHTTKK
jgi:hypothetical protein